MDRMERFVKDAKLTDAAAMIRREGILSREAGDTLVRTPHRLTYTFYELLRRGKVAQQRVVFVQEPGQVKLVGLRDTQLSAKALQRSDDALIDRLNWLEQKLNQFVAGKEKDSS